MGIGGGEVAKGAYYHRIQYSVSDSTPGVKFGGKRGVALIGNFDRWIATDITS